MADDLLSMFMSMGTSDHETLVNQFQQVVQIDPAAAHFFLEATNWNLAVAVGTFMDQGGQLGNFQTQNLPAGELVCDVTFGEGEEINPGSQFTKTWRLRNSGAAAWERGAMLVPVRSGETMGAPEFVHVNPLAPGEVADISVVLQAPRECGSYASAWRLRDQHNYFSEEIWVIITVSEGGMLTALQGMNNTAISNGQPHGFQAVNQPSQQTFFGQPAQDMGMGMAADAGQFAPMQAAPTAASPGSFGIPKFGSLDSHAFGGAGASQFGGGAPQFGGGASPFAQQAGGQGGPAAQEDSMDS